MAVLVASRSLPGIRSVRHTIYNTDKTVENIARMIAAGISKEILEYKLEGRRDRGRA
jgi:uncharacterized protein (DUF433 family)